MAKREAQYTYTDEELLALVREAIVNLIAGAQEYRIGSKSWRGVDLAELRLIRDDLEARTGTGPSSTRSGLVRVGTAFGRPD